METRRDDRRDAGIKSPAIVSANADIEAAKRRAMADADNKLNEAQLEAIEQETLRNRYRYPRPDPTTAPPMSANAGPPHPTLEQVLEDLSYPATRGDLVSRARERGAFQDMRYQLERIEDRMYLDHEDVMGALRAV